MNWKKCPLSLVSTLIGFDYGTSLIHSQRHSECLGSLGGPAAEMARGAAWLSFAGWAWGRRDHVGLVLLNCQTPGGLVWEWNILMYKIS